MPKDTHSDDISEKAKRPQFRGISFSKTWASGIFWALGGIFAGVVSTTIVLRNDGEIPLWAVGVGLIGIGLVLSGVFGIRKQIRLSELLLAASEARDEITAITNRQGHIIYEHPDFFALLGGGSIRRKGETLNPFDVLESSLSDEEAMDEYRRVWSAALDGRAAQAEVTLNGEGGEKDKKTQSRLHLTCQPIKGAGGYTLWVGRDITAKSQVADNLKQEVRAMQGVLDNLPVGFFVCDAKGKIYYINHTFADWIGIKVNIPDTRDLYLSDFLISRNDHRVDADNQFATITMRDGMGETINALLMETRTPEGFINSVVVRTGRLDLDKGEELEQGFKWLFQKAPVGIVLLDRQGNVVDCNRAFLSFLGFHRDKIVKEPLSDRIVDEDQETFRTALKRIVGGKDAAAQLDLRMPSSGFRELHATVYVSPVKGRDGTTIGLVLHFVDNTERKNLEVQFTEAQKMQALGQLAGGIAHDFNNLLTAIIGFCDLLLSRHGPKDPSFNDINQIRQNANRAANLVRQLLAFSRKQTLKPDILDVTEALNELSNLLRRLIGEQVTLNIEHGTNVGTVLADPGQFDQVIVNLAINARDAMSGQGELTVRTSRVIIDAPVKRGHEVMAPGDYVRIEVVDTGSGIDEENLNHIFEPFFTTKEVGAGTGLGLSTVYGIVRQTDGYIFVDSELGKGTTFSIYIPRYQLDLEELLVGDLPPTDQPGKSAEKARGDLTGAGTVLLVEDEDSVRLFGARALSNIGYRVIEATNGENALRLIDEQAEPIDLIITDVVMPGMDGQTLVKKLKSEQPDVKVILISGYTDHADEINAEADKLNYHFLPKPFSLEQLASKVKDVMDA